MSRAIFWPARLLLKEMIYLFERRTSMALPFALWEKLSQMHASISISGESSRFSRLYKKIYVSKYSGSVSLDREHPPLVGKQEDLGVGISGLAVAPGREPGRADQRDDQP